MATPSTEPAPHHFSASEIASLKQWFRIYGNPRTGWTIRGSEPSVMGGPRPTGNLASEVCRKASEDIWAAVTKVEHGSKVDPLDLHRA